MLQFLLFLLLAGHQTILTAGTRNNSWDRENAGTAFNFYANGNVIIHSPMKRFQGQNKNTVRAVLPVPPVNWNADKSYVAAYFEINIIKLERFGFLLGFCDGTVPPNKDFGKWQNSIGIRNKNGPIIDQTFKRFGSGNHFTNEAFHANDVVGAGIVHAPTMASIHFFATLNGTLLGKIELPEKFLNLTLYPALTSDGPGNKFRVNFGENTTFDLQTMEMNF